jgi:hypothetical protein
MVRVTVERDIFVLTSVVPIRYDLYKLSGIFSYRIESLYTQKKISCRTHSYDQVTILHAMICLTTDIVMP